MSRARRLPPDAAVTPFPWSGDGGDASPTPTPERPATPAAPLARPPSGGAPSPSDVERDAFARGYAEGEQAGAEAAGRQIEERLQRMTATLDELATLRQRVIQRTERQMVELALTVARRILGRETSLDRDLIAALARVALDRIGECAGVTIRLHPQDYALATAQGQDWPGDLSLVADESIAPGGCRVEADAGFIEAGVDAQLAEIERAVLGDEPTTTPTDPSARSGS